VVVQAEPGQRLPEPGGGADQRQPPPVAQRQPVAGADRPQAGGVTVGQPDDIDGPRVTVARQQGPDGIGEHVRGAMVEPAAHLEPAAAEVDPDEERRGVVLRTFWPGERAGEGHVSTSVRKTVISQRIPITRKDSR
jgi:hypothetical protein